MLIASASNPTYKEKAMPPNTSMCSGFNPSDQASQPERLSMSWRWTGGAEDPGESLVEIRLRAVAEGTELTFTHSRLHDEESRRSHEEGWTGALDKLERHFLVIERSSP
jgi:Activator of Hsp90 ATPase homolog 1-like protein